jgi:hypothetical protein
MHASVVHACKAHAYEMRAHIVHTHETYAHQKHAHRGVAFSLGMKCQRTLKANLTLGPVTPGVQYCRQAGRKELSV